MSQHRDRDPKKIVGDSEKIAQDIQLRTLPTTISLCYVILEYIRSRGIVIQT